MKYQKKDIYKRHIDNEELIRDIALMVIKNRDYPRDFKEISDKYGLAKNYIYKILDSKFAMQRVNEQIRKIENEKI